MGEITDASLTNDPQKRPFNEFYRSYVRGYLDALADVEKNRASIPVLRAKLEALQKVITASKSTWP